MTTILSLPATTKEYIFLPVKATDADGALVDVTDDVVEAALLSDLAEPTDDDWAAAAWEEGGPVNGYYRVQVLVGPDGSGADHELDPGRYQAWVRVTDLPEQPVRNVGQVNYGT